MALDGSLDQLGGVALLIRPEVDIGHLDALCLQRGQQVVAQEGGLAGPARGGKEQAIRRVAEEGVPPHGVRHVSGQLMPGKVDHGFTGFYLNSDNLSA
ncbi:hypothetical protein [Halomonas litopenaei]|uniref:hypothetical protein n=1 Tax=Halomonas litopenaei TaxID=2109328 RepID=UPI003FA060AE